MATGTYYKIILNDSIVLPDVYTTYDSARAADRIISAQNSPCVTKVVSWDDETGKLGN